MERALERPFDGTENGNMLHKAYAIINGDRQKEYGDPWDNFGLLAEFFTSYVRKRWGVGIEFKRTDVVNFLELLKISRACTEKPTMDTYVDIAGYAGLGGDFVCRQHEEKPSPLIREGECAHLIRVLSREKERNEEAIKRVSEAKKRAEESMRSDVPFDDRDDIDESIRHLNAYLCGGIHESDRK